MKNIIGSIFLLLVLSGLSVFGQGKQKKADKNKKSVETVAVKEDKGIHFEHSSWEEVKALAKKENKYIFVDVYAYWCGPCKKMTRETFSDETVGEFYNKNFVSYKIDMGKPENRAEGAVFKAAVYPTLVYFNNEGEEVYRFKGFRPAAAFMKEGKRALFDADKMAALEQKFKDGERSYDFLYEYLEYAGYKGKPKAEAVDAFMEKLNKKELKKEKTQDLIYELGAHYESPFFQVLLKNKELFEDRYTKPAVEKRIRSVALNLLRTSVDNKDEKSLEKAINLIKDTELEKKEQLIFQMGLEFYNDTEDWDNYIATSVEFLDNNEMTNPNILNHVAWTFFTHTEDDGNLLKAESWARKAIQLKKDYPNTHTLAALLYKQGKSEEAKTTADQAIDIAKRTRKNPAPTEELIRIFEEN